MKKTIQNAHERHHAAVVAAMPEVKSLVAKHGRTVINGCLKRIGEHDKQAKKLRELKAEVAKLEREL